LSQLIKEIYMYKTFTAEDFRKFHGFDTSYVVDGIFVVGTYKVQKEVDRLKKVLAAYEDTRLLKHTDEFLETGYEFTVNGKRIWFFVVYGGTLLSEFLHVACMLGSKKNILSGVCGGLQKGAKVGDIILPTEATSDGSSVYMYDREQKPHQQSDDTLRSKIKDALTAKNMKVHEGKTVTCQAMLGETKEDVLGWSRDGYLGVEMEASTVFAVSRHFHVPSAAILSIADNLIDDHTVLSENFEESRQLRESVRDAQFEVAVQQIVSD
jgi:purine-nucleoside phosphorylase